MLHRIALPCSLKFRQHILKFQLLKQSVGLIRKIALRRSFFIIQFNVAVRLDGCQHLGQVCKISVIL